MHRPPYWIEHGASAHSLILADDHNQRRGVPWTRRDQRDFAATHDAI